MKLSTKQTVRTMLGVTAGVGLLAATILTAPNAAAADSCGWPSGAHCYSVANHGATTDSSAFNLTMHANYMTPGCSSASQPNHIRAEEWVRMSDKSYLEMGIINSWAYWSDNKLSSPTNVYAFFWSDTDTQGHQYIHTIRNTTPDGSTHTFSIQRTAPKTWAFILDGSVVGVSGIVKAANASQHQIGLEYAGPNSRSCGAHSDRFEMQPSVYYSNSGWSQWHDYTLGTVSDSFHREGHMASNPTYIAFWKDT